jgi:hypothetical protein
MEAQFAVNKKEAEGFSKVWKTKGGLVVPIPDHALDFATDFANVVLANFIDVCKKRAALERAAHEAKIKENKDKLIAAGGGLI